MKKAITLIVILVILGLSYIAYSHYVKRSVTLMTVEQGWTNYKSDEFGIAFQYPETWSLAEQRADEKYNKENSARYPTGELVAIDLNGDGYTLKIDRMGHGIQDAEYKHPVYTISGEIAEKTYETQTTSGFRQILLLPRSICNGVNMYIENTNSFSKEITDKILSTVACTKSS